MGTTSPDGFRYHDLGNTPDGADLGKDLADDVQAKVVAIDTAIDGIWSVNSSQAADITALENANTAQGFQFIRKTADELVASNDTPQLDNHLFFTAAASQRYIVEVVLFVDVAGGNSTTDFRASWLMPLGATASFMGSGPTPTMAGGSATGDGNWGAQYGASTAYLPFGLYSAGITGITIRGIIVQGVNSGTVTFAWSQDVPSANGVTVKANSYMKVNKIS